MPRVELWQLPIPPAARAGSMGRDVEPGSRGAQFMTGEVISIDGGATSLNPARPSGQKVGGG